MATRNIVPRATGEGSIGTAAKHWGAGHFDSLPNWQEYLAESTGYGIVSGCEPTISGLTVTVGAGVVHLSDGTRKEIAETSVTLDSADSTNPRIDLVYIDSTGTVAKITGTAAASPSAPAVPTGGISVCNVSVAAGATTGVVKTFRDIIPTFKNLEQHDNGCVFVYTQIPKTPQDATVYNNKMFYLDTVEGAETGNLKVLDLSTNQIISSTVLDGGAKPHGNTICFGYKQNPNDTYPLLYVTGYDGLDENGNDLERGICYVYKVNNDLTTSFVQKISIGFVDDDLWTNGYSESDVTCNSEFKATEGNINYGDFVIDTDSHKLYVITNTNVYPITRMFQFEIPNTSSGNVILTTSDIVEYKNLPLYRWPQGACYYAGKIYFSHGYFWPGDTIRGDSGVAIIDLQEKTQVGYIPSKNYFTEMEAAFIWNDDLYIGGNGQNNIIKVDGFKKVTNTGDIRALRTRYNDNLVQAINSAKKTAQVVESSFTNVLMGVCAVNVNSTSNLSEGFCKMLVDAITPIKNACLDNAEIGQRGRTVGFYHFIGVLRGANNAGGFFHIEGDLSDNKLYFDAWQWEHKNEALRVSHDGTEITFRSITPFTQYDGYSSRTIQGAINATYPIRTQGLYLTANVTYLIKPVDSYAALMVEGEFGTNDVRCYILMRDNDEPVIKDVGDATGIIAVTKTAPATITLKATSGAHVYLRGTSMFDISLSN